MARFLPPQPDLEHLKNEAKALLKARETGDVSACLTLRRLKRFAGATDSEIRSARVALTEAQFALAMDYGFGSWNELRQAVLDRKPLARSQAPLEEGALRLPDPPAAKPGAHRLTSAYHLALSCCGIACDYDTISGDTGMAFILQADSLHTAWGANRRELDIGYWPVDPWGSYLRLDFLGRVYGQTFRTLPGNMDEYRQDAAQHYRRHYEPEVRRSLGTGKPVLALEYDMYVVTAMDAGTPPLLGQVACSDKAQINRMGHYPWSLIVLDESCQSMARQAADAQAVEFAIGLHNDRYGRPLSGKTSGKASFALWARLLRDPEMRGPHFYHANVVGQLRQLRASVPPYLRQMALRHAQPVGAHLDTAAGIYEEIVARLAAADTSKTAFGAETGPLRLADAVDEIAGLESRAIGELELALQAMGGSKQPEMKE